MAQGLSELLCRRSCRSSGSNIFFFNAPLRVTYRSLAVLRLTARRLRLR